MTPQTTPLLPRAIWMDGGEGFLPDCYQGTPLEMVQEMASEMAIDIGVHEAIDFLILMFRDTEQAHIDIPDENESEDVRSQFFIASLLAARIAHPMAEA